MIGRSQYKLSFLCKILEHAVQMSQIFWRLLMPDYVMRSLRKYVLDSR